MSPAPFLIGLFIMGKRKHETDLLNGSVCRTLIGFSVPFVLASLLQMAYTSVDVYFMGKYASSTALAGTFQGMGIVGALTYFFYGIANGGAVLLGQEVGAEKKQDASRTLGNLITLSAVSAVLAMLLIEFCGKIFIAWMNVPEEAVDESWKYLHTCMFGLVFVMGYNIVSSVLRSLGNSKVPFLFIIISSVLNILFDYVTVGLWHLAATGAALSTITSQGICFILSLLYLYRKKLPFDFRIRHCRPEKKQVRKILTVGLPLSLQSILNNVSMMVATAMINTLGLYVVAGISVVNTIASFSIMVPMSMGSAISAMTAQNIGARKTERARKILFYGTLFSLLCAVPACLAMNLWPEAIAGILNKEPPVLVESVRYLKSVSFNCILVCVMFCFSGFFNGCGKTLFSMLLEGLSALLVRIPATWLILHLVPNVTALQAGFAWPLTSLVSSIACIIYYRRRFSGDKLEQISLVASTPGQ